MSRLRSLVDNSTKDVIGKESTIIIQFKILVGAITTNICQFNPNLKQNSIFMTVIVVDTRQFSFSSLIQNVAPKGQESLTCEQHEKFPFTRSDEFHFWVISRGKGLEVKTMSKCDNEWLKMCEWSFDSQLPNPEFGWDLLFPAFPSRVELLKSSFAFRKDLKLVCQGSRVERRMVSALSEIIFTLQ